MAASRALILQGILGVAGLCASSAGGIGLGLGKTFLEVQNDAPAPSANDSSLESVALEDIEEVEEDGGDLGIPKECDTTCVLTAEQLKKLKFEAKGDEEITFEGLDEADEFELLIEETEDQINYPRGKKYILKPKTISGTVTIKNIKEGNIVLDGSKEVVIREVIGGGKLEHLLEEVDRLGIPKRCKADEDTGETTKTCELTQRLQLEKLKFETRDGEKITVEGLNEGNKVTLAIEDKEDDGDNYPQGKKYKLTSTGYVLIEGVKGGNILLEKDKEFVIREKKEGGRLEEVLDEVDRLGIPKKCKADEVKGATPKTCHLVQKQLKDLKFETKEGASVAVEGWSDISRFELTIEDKEGDEENYPKGKKYTLKAKTGTATIRGIKDGDITIWDDQEVVIREKKEGGKLEKAPEEVDELGIPESCALGKTCQLTEYQIKNLKLETNGDEGITVEGIKKAKTVILKIEDKQGDTDNYPNGKKYILSVRNGQQVTIKNIKEGDIEIGKEVAVIRKKQGDIKKLEKAPKEELDKLGIPRRCNADSATVASIQKCELTKEELEKLKFEPESGSSSISIDGLDGSDDKVELAIAMVNDDTDNYHKGKNKKYTFKALKDEVTIKGAKGGNIVLDQNKGVVFRETNEGNKLETYLDVLGIPRGCKAEEVKGSSDSRTCKLTQDHLKNLKFKVFEDETEDVKVDGLGEKEKITLTISWDENKNTYPENKKYSFDNTSNKNKDIKITKGNQTVTITKQTETRFKTEEGQLALAETKSEIEIKKENKLKEVREIVKKLGFEGSSTLSINFSGYNDNPTRHGETKVVEFSKKNGNESDLKKIQFQALGGGATWVTDLSSWNIKVFLDWDDNFPKNMKFSFQNQSFSAGFEFKKGSSIVKIAQKTQTTPMPTFKVEQQGDNWYLVRS